MQLIDFNLFKRLELELNYISIKPKGYYYCVLKVLL
jgi:hypothetical protein